MIRSSGRKVGVSRRGQARCASSNSSQRASNTALIDSRPTRGVRKATSMPSSSRSAMALVVNCYRAPDDQPLEVEEAEVRELGVVFPHLQTLAPSTDHAADGGQVQW